MSRKCKVLPCCKNDCCCEQIKKDTYNKAINDFVSELKDSPIPFTGDLSSFDKWVELKGKDMLLR